MLLQEDIDSLANGFIAICQNIKDSIGQQLDSQFVNYKQQFVSLKDNIGTHFQIGSRWRHAGSHSHLLAKMQQVPSHKLGLEIDKVLINLRRIEGSNWAHRVQEIESQIQQVGDKNTTLPVYRNDFDTNHILDKLKNTVEIALNDNMNLKST